MKKLVFLGLSILMMTASFAQNQLATLLHNDSITAFYGPQALQSAHAAAVNGDVITLSEGSFESVDITKAVTIRGAGMYADSVARTMPTMLQGDFIINVPQDSTNNCFLTLEGIYHYENVKYQQAYNPFFLKCKFKKITYYIVSSSSMNNARFLNCIIEQFDYPGNNKVKGTHFINSVVLDGLSSDISCTLENSIAKINTQYTNSNSIINSIVYCSGCGTSSNNGRSSFYSIGISGSSSREYYDTVTVRNNLHNYHLLSDVFKTFTGSYTDATMFQLKDSIAATVIGTDGTQVGIYGGPYPFDPSVRNPLIGHATVSRTTTSEGKLEVEIQVLSEE